VPVLLVILPPLIAQIGEGLREHYRRKHAEADRIAELERRVAELEKWKNT
jgi:hypothetical protein